MTDKMIWGLDTATKVTGWTVGTGETRPTTGAFRYAPTDDDLGLIATRFRADLGALADRFGMADVIIYEAPLLNPGRDKLLTLRKLFGVGMVLEDWGQTRGAIVREVGNGKIKKRITGHGRGDKEDVLRVVRDRLNIELPAGEAAKDAADSFGAWLTGGVDEYAKHYQARWDHKLLTGRGMLL